MKRMSLMAVTAMMTTGAFAATGNPGAHTDIVLNRMEISKQVQQNEDLETNIQDQQREIYDLVQDKEGIESDLQTLELKKQQALSNGRSSKVTRLDKRITWNQAMLKADEDNIREDLAAERSDMRLMNQNGVRIDSEEAAIARDKGMGD